MSAATKHPLGTAARRFLGELARAFAEQPYTQFAAFEGDGVLVVAARGAQRNKLEDLIAEWDGHIQSASSQAVR